MIGNGVIGCDGCSEPILGRPVILLLPLSGTEVGVEQIDYCSRKCLLSDLNPETAEELKAEEEAREGDGGAP